MGFFFLGSGLRSTWPSPPRDEMSRRGLLECSLDCEGGDIWWGEDSCSDNSLSFRLRLGASASDILAKQVNNCACKDLCNKTLRIRFGYNIKKCVSRFDEREQVERKVAIFGLFTFCTVGVRVRVPAFHALRRLAKQQNDEMALEQAGPELLIVGCSILMSGALCIVDMKTFNHQDLGRSQRLKVIGGI